MYDTSEFRNGLKIEYNGKPYEMVFFQHIKPGKGQSFTRTKIKNLLDGSVLEPTFKSGDKVKKPDMEAKEMQYLYREAENYYFMDTTSYEQIFITAESLGDNRFFLQEQAQVGVLMFNGRPISVDLPPHVNLKITKCDPGLRGDTATGTTKPATLESGGLVNVPLFVNEGDVIRIDTRNGQYVERVKA